MKTLHLPVIIIIVIMSLSFLLSDKTAHGLWVPQSPQELLNGSETIFIGNITSVNTFQLEKNFTYVTEENGIDKTVVQNYTLNLDQYQVNVEEFLKNPQSSNKMTVRQPTIPSGPGHVSGISGFKIGDRVLFYVQTLDGNNTYSPESFVIPKICTSKDVLTQERFEMGSEFLTLQNGMKVDYGNFTENKPIQFLYHRDMGTLFGKSFDVLVGITKMGDQSTQPIFIQEIHSESKPCQWIASAEWEFTPKKGEYAMNIITKYGNNTQDASYTTFSVKPDVGILSHTPPLQQFKSGVAANDVICRPDMQLLIQNQENLPICAKLGSVSNLLHRNWSYPTDCKYVRGPFTAGVEGIIIIEKNASNQFSDKSYLPRNSTVIVGWNNTVSWENLDDVTSSVTSDWNLFDSGPILPGADWQHDFECAGNYGYHSEPHQWMKGWIRVLPPSGS